MADRLRIVRRPLGGRPVVVRDLSDGRNVIPVRESFTIEAPQAERVMAPLRGRKGGNRQVGERLGNGAVSCVVAVLNDTSPDEALARWSSIAADAASFVPGTFLEWRPDGASQSTYFELMGSATQRDPGYKWAAFVGAKWLTVALRWEVSPLALGDPMDVHERWDDPTAITGGDWSMVVGSLSSVEIGDRELRSTDAALFTLIRAAEGYAYTDLSVKWEYRTGASLAGFNTGVRLCHADSLNWLQVDQTVGGLVVRRTVGGISTATSTAYATAANTRYWVRGIRMGAKVVAQLWTAEPTPLGTPAATLTYDLTAAEQAAFPSGSWGLFAQVDAVDEVFGPVTCEPFTYHNVTTPEIIRLAGTIPGDAPALADLHVTTSGAGSGSGSSAGTGGEDYPVWALFGWNRRGLVGNDLWNGDLSDSIYGITPWGNGAVTGVIATASGGVTRDTTLARAKYGAASLRIQTGATSDAGANVPVARRFKRGRAYLAWGWVSSAAGPTSVRAKLGVNGDISTGAGFALTPTPSLRSALWQPTADRDGAYVAFGQSTATSTDFNASNSGECEAFYAILGTAIGTGDNDLAFTGQVPAQWPDDDGFLLLLDPGTTANELIYVPAGSVDRDARTANGVIRGAEGSTISAHSAGVPAVLLPQLRTHYEGRGAAAPFGIIEAETAAGVDTFAFTADTDYRCGSGLQATAAGAGSAAAIWLVDPNLLDADDGETTIGLDVYARVEVDGDLVTPTLASFCFPDGMGVGWPVFQPSTLGASGKVIAKPGDSNADFRIVHLGMLPLPVDRDRSARWLLRVAGSWQSGSSGVLGLDYVIVVPHRRNLRGPERQVLDTTYPRFVESTAETMRVIRGEDASGLIARPPRLPAGHHGLAGATGAIEIPPGMADLVLKLSSMVCDDPTTTLTDSEFEEHAATVHLAVTPRWNLVRS